MAPATLGDVASERLFYRGKPHGFDFSPLFQGWPHEMAWARQPLTTECLLAAPQAMWTHKLHDFPAARARLPYRTSLRFQATRAGEVDALVLWFHAAFGEGVSLTNAPGCPPTHWQQYALPLENGGLAQAGSEVAVEFACIPAFEGYCHNAWSVRVGTLPWEHHDTRCALTAAAANSSRPPS
jgi:hypothetical protein